MLFEEIENIKFRKYTSDITEVRRHIDLKKETAEAVNKVIAVANKNNKGIKLNNTILFNLAIKNFLKNLKNFLQKKL